MSAVSRKVTPASRPASRTASVSSCPIRPPKLLHPSPTTLASSSESPSRRVGSGVEGDFDIVFSLARRRARQMRKDAVMTTDAAPAPTYSIPQEFLDFRETIRQIATERIAPRAGEIDRSAEYPWDVRELLAEQDILGLPFSEDHGGTGTGTLMLQIAVEEIAKACASSALILMIQELGTLPIQLFGSDELKQRLLPKCASGEWSPAFALSEPEAGSDPASMRTTAVRDGDEWVINGQKSWITNATIADFYVVFATTDRANRRTSAFVVEKDAAGFDPGKLEHKLGIKGSPTGSPSFTDVRVPEENVIGEIGKGLNIALGTLERTRLGAAAQAVGIAQGATDYANGYAKERVA